LLASTRTGPSRTRVALSVRPSASCAAVPGLAIPSTGAVLTAIALPPTHATSTTASASFCVPTPDHPTRRPLPCRRAISQPLPPRTRSRGCPLPEAERGRKTATLLRLGERELDRVVPLLLPLPASGRGPGGGGLPRLPISP